MLCGGGEDHACDVLSVPLDGDTGFLSVCQQVVYGEPAGSTAVGTPHIECPNRGNGVDGNRPFLRRRDGHSAIRKGL